MILIRINVNDSVKSYIYSSNLILLNLWRLYSFILERP